MVRLSLSLSHTLSSVKMLSFYLSLIHIHTYPAQSHTHTSHLHTRSLRHSTTLQHLDANIRFEHTQPRGPKKHLKRINAPKHMMLDKMGGAWVSRPSAGPHKLRECLPIILVLRNRLKLALNRREVQMICMERLVQVDGAIRSDPCFPTGFMDVVSLGDADKCFDAKASVDRYRLLYDVKGRFKLIPVKPSEANKKLLKVKKKFISSKKVPCIVSHDGRTIRYVLCLCFFFQLSLSVFSKKMKFGFASIVFYVFLVLSLQVSDDDSNNLIYII